MEEEESIYVSMYKEMPTEELTLEDFEMHSFHRLEGESRNTIILFMKVESHFLYLFFVGSM